MDGYNVNPKYIKLVPTWEAAARIFTNNLMYGNDLEVQYKSAEELVKMGQHLDKYIAEQIETES